MSSRETIGPWKESQLRWLAGKELGGGFGAAVAVTVAAGEGYDVHTIGANERIVYLLSGQGQHRGSGGAIEMESDDVLILQPGSWHGFENTGSEEATLWVAWTPDTAFPELDFAVAEDPDADLGGGITTKQLRASVVDPSTTPEDQGFERMDIRWIGEETQAITLGWARVGAGGGHNMHLHRQADEVIYIEQGTGHHTTPDSVTQLEAPAYDFVPAGEWHEMVVPEGRVEGAFFYLGANNLDASGYELADK